MTELKTKVSNESVSEFISRIDNRQKNKDCSTLLEIFKNVTWEKPKIWWDSIIGFWSYHYKSKKSKQEWDWPLTWFSLRKNNITIYIMPGFNNYKDYLDNIWVHKKSIGSCLYIKTLSDISVDVLKLIIKESVEDMKKKYNA